MPFLSIFFRALNHILTMLSLTEYVYAVNHSVVVISVVGCLILIFALLWTTRSGRRASPGAGVQAFFYRLVLCIHAAANLVASGLTVMAISTPLGRGGLDALGERGAGVGRFLLAMVCHLVLIAYEGPLLFTKIALGQPAAVFYAVQFAILRLPTLVWFGARMF